MLIHLAISARNLLFPPLCRACGEALGNNSEELLCSTCRRALRLILPPVCPRCGVPSTDPECTWCRGKPYAFELARSAALYERPLRELILEFKFKGSPRAQEFLLDLFVSGAERHFPERPFEAIVPVPLHPWRRFQREFNQAEVLAEALSRKWSLPHLPRVLRRVGWRPPQSRLSGKWRAENLGKTFRAGERGVEGLRVLLVDDVMTTGLTLSTCAEILVESGARRVSALTLARRLPKRVVRGAGDRQVSVE